MLTRMDLLLFSGIHGRLLGLVQVLVRKLVLGDIVLRRNSQELLLLHPLQLLNKLEVVLGIR